MIAQQPRRTKFVVVAALTGLILAHVVLAITYARLTPYRTPGYLFIARSRPWSPVPDIGAPDERQHANYVIHILEGKGLPIYRVMIPDPSNPGQLTRNPNLGEVYEFHQPPLYYVLAAGYGRLTGMTAAEASDPSQGVGIRFLNAFVGGATVLGVFFLCSWGFLRINVGLLAAGITALLPMHLALDGMVSNDPLLFCICTWTLAICARAVRNGWTQTSVLAVGALIGLGLLTKSTALALIPVALAAFWLQRPKWSQALTSMGVALALVLPYWVRNQRLYGDPLGLTSFQELFAGAPKASDLSAFVGPVTYWLQWVGWWTARSFFGVFGYMDIFLNERGTSYDGPGAPNALYRALLVLCLAASAGFAIYLSKLRERSEKRVHLLNGIFLALITLLFVRYNISFFQGQARYFYPAIGPISAGLALGALYLAKSKTRIISLAMAAILLGLNVYALTKLPGEFAKRVDPVAAGYPPPT